LRFMGAPFRVVDLSWAKDTGERRLFRAVGHALTRRRRVLGRPDGRAIGATPQRKHRQRGAYSCGRWMTILAESGHARE